LELCWRFEFEVWGWRVVALGEWEEGSGAKGSKRGMMVVAAAAGKTAALPQQHSPPRR